MFFFQGESDVNTPTQPVEEYFPTIQAPEKELVLLKDCRHVALWSKSDVFLKELIARVRPLAESTQPGRLKTSTFPCCKERQ